MINIIVSNNEVKIESKVYHSFNNKETLAKMIEDVVNQSKYSKESIRLWMLREGSNSKQLFNNWYEYLDKTGM